jgi:hypothetical protein
MKKLFLISEILFTFSCNQSPKNNAKVQAYQTVETILEGKNEFDGKTISVEGKVVEVSEVMWDHFRIVGTTDSQGIRVMLGEKFPKIDRSIIGKTVEIKGKFEIQKMDLKDVRKWKEFLKSNMVGKENTELFKNKHAFIEDIENRIIGKKIPYFTRYNIVVENYNFR